MSTRFTLERHTSQIRKNFSLQSTKSPPGEGGLGEVDGMRGYCAQTCKTNDAQRAIVMNARMRGIMGFNSPYDLQSIAA